MSEKKDYTPFDGLTDQADFGEYSIVRESQKDPTLVVKERKGFLEWTSLNDDAAKELQGYIEIIKNLPISEFFPRTQLVIGKDHVNRTVLYEISEKIDGHNLSRAISDKEKQSLLTFLSLLVDFYAETFKNGKGIFPEFDKPENYKFGQNLHNPTGDKLYMVDLAPLYQGSLVNLITNIERFSKAFYIPFSELQPIIDKVKSINKK